MQIFQYVFCSSSSQWPSLWFWRLRFDCKEIMEIFVYKVKLGQICLCFSFYYSSDAVYSYISCIPEDGLQYTHSLHFEHHLWPSTFNFTNYILCIKNRSSTNGKMFVQSVSAHANHIYIFSLFKTVLIVTVEFLCSQSLMLELTYHLYWGVFTDKILFVCCDLLQ